MVDIPCAAVTITSPCFQTLERLVVLMYDTSSELTSVNEARRDLFIKKNKDLENIPPTQMSLIASFVFGRHAIWRSKYLSGGIKGTMQSGIDMFARSRTDNWQFAAFFSYVWRFGAFLCKCVHYIQNVSAICSVTTLTMMSMERYYAIVHPMKAKYVCTVGRARRAILVLWVLSFILATPILIGRVQITVGLYRKATWCLKQWDRQLYAELYDIYMFCIILLIPVHIMSFAYFRICQELWFMSRDRIAMRTASDMRSCQHYGRPTQNSTPNRWSLSEKSPVLKVKFTEDDSTKKQVIKMLVAIVIVFIVCWAPILINNILVAFGVLPLLHVPPFKYFREAFHVLSYANSCINPIVYGFMSRNFRKTFVRALCSCLRGRQYVRKLTFKNHQKSYIVHEKWNKGTGARHSELATTTEMLEMTEKSSSDDGEKV